MPATARVRPRRNLRRARAQFFNVVRGDELLAECVSIDCARAFNKSASGWRNQPAPRIVPLEVFYRPAKRGGAR